MTKNLLIVTQYFPPEVGAPQNRLFELAVRLKKEGINITVLTAMPNYPLGEIHKGYQHKKYVFEEIEGIPVHRSSIYATPSKNLVKRLRNYFSFVFSSYFIGYKKIKESFDYVLCESPPLFLGISAYRIAKKQKAKFIFNVSDLWPESAEKLNLVNNRLLLNAAYKLEAFLYRKADLITGQTQGIVSNIKERFPEKKTYWLPNGVDVRFFDPERFDRSWRKERGYKNDDILILYAGIIGHAQGLEIILKTAHYFSKNENIKFILLGSGPLKDELIAQRDAQGLSNVIFEDLVPKSKIPSIIKSCDISLVPLKKLDIFKGAIPSKIFENCAMKKMLLLGVEGEAKKLFIEDGKAGLFFEPENEIDLKSKIEVISNNPESIEDFGENARNYVDNYFNRDNIAKQFLKELKRLN
jgi:glycosyltransferase involved in cell wall biosynthesis